MVSKERTVDVARIEAAVPAVRAGVAVRLCPPEVRAVRAVPTASWTVPDTSGSLRARVRHSVLGFVSLDLLPRFSLLLYQPFRTSPFGKRNPQNCLKVSLC